MSEFALKSIIPTESDSKGLVFSDSLYFSSNNVLHKVRNNKLSVFSTVDGDIQMFSINKNNCFIATSSRVFMNYYDNNIGSLRRSVTAIACNEEFLALGFNNILEIWYIPKEYKLTQFKLHSKNVGHYRNIKFINFIDNDRILTASEDCTVRIFNLKLQTSKTIANLRDIIVGINYYNDVVTVVSKNGGILSIDISKYDYKPEILKYEGSISACGFHSDVTCLAISSIPIKKNKAEPLLPDKSEKHEKLELSKNTTLFVLKNQEEIYKGDVDFLVDDLRINNLRVALKSKTFVGVFDINLQKFSFGLDLPKFNNILCWEDLISAGCSDRKIRIYKKGVESHKLFDEKSNGTILNTHLNRNSCFVVYKTGYISVFNYNDGTCYKSFSINTELGGFSYSSISDDGVFLFISNVQDIHVVDIKKGVLVDKIILESAIISMCWYKDHLYTLEINKTLTKYNIFSNTSINIILENMPICMKIKNNTVAVSTIDEIIFYDNDLIYKTSFKVVLEARSRDEMFNRLKSVENFDFSTKNIFCGGKANKIKILKLNSEGCLNPNALSQTIQISKNKDWENYKEKLYKESTSDFNKQKVIQALNIFAFDRKFIVLTSSGVFIYEVNETKLNVLEFDIKATPDFVNDCLSDCNFIKALMAALKINDFNLIKQVIDTANDVDYVIKYIPRSYIESLVIYVQRLILENTGNIRYYEFINKIIYYHRITVPGLFETLKDDINDNYQLVLKNKYLVRALIEIKKSESE